MGAVIRGPLSKGMLSGKFDLDTTFPQGDIRHTWPNEPWYREQLAKVERLRVLQRDGQNLSQLALRFVLSHPAVSVAIPGGKTPQQVEENAAASVRPLLSDDELRLIDEVAPATKLDRAADVR